MSIDVGERLRFVRARNKISQRELAKRSGVTNSTISLIESNQMNPSVGAQNGPGRSDGRRHERGPDRGRHFLGVLRTGHPGHTVRARSQRGHHGRHCDEHASRPNRRRQPAAHNVLTVRSFELRH